MWRALTSVAKTDERWIKFFLEPEVGANVPLKVAELLEVARGAMIYSLFFNPLATIGTDQCYRVLETAVRMRCEQVGIKLGRFEKNIDSLVNRKIISPISKPRWHAIRHLRNSSSHPERQWIVDPGQARRTLAIVVDCLEELFR
jgi:hypothetical protein